MKRNLPTFQGLNAAPSAGYEILPSALQKWNPTVRAAAADDAASIGIYDVVGDPWSDNPVTAKRIAAILRTIGAENPVVVNINSPGGDVFEGLAIYNLLREHKGAVTVRVLGVAASIASIIAMAGDEVQIARTGFLMVHNSWTYAAGNRNDFRALADTLEPFDRAMASVYAARTGEAADAMAELMDAESWIGGEAAVDQGFADALLASDAVAENKKSASLTFAQRQMDAALARGGMSRKERRELMASFKSATHNAGGDGEPSATGTSTSSAALLEEIRALASKINQTGIPS